MQNNEVIDQLDEIERAELIKIDAALNRIENGSFGICSECSGAIGEKRLKAVPFATICIDCKEE